MKKLSNVKEIYEKSWWFTFDIFYKYFWKIMFYQMSVGKPSFTSMS